MLDLRLRVLENHRLIYSAISFARDRIWKRHGDDWCRVVMNRETLRLVTALGPEGLDVLEVSGTGWRDLLPFRSYLTVDYPNYDLCAERLTTEFDLIVAEQVFEHLPYPRRAGLNAHAMLRPGGHLLMTTPFLLKVHNHPMDCTRWTETGARFFLADCGFPIDSVVTGSWGNRACVVGNFRTWARYNRWVHSLRNEPDYPVVVWALARK
jgi:SAM-dependent methyltransferase